MSAAPASINGLRGTERYVTAADGTRVRYALFPPAAGRRAVARSVLLPGFSEFIEKYLESIGDLQARGHAVLCLDWRGQGLSDRPLADRMLIHVETMDHFLADLDRILRQSGFAAGRDVPLLVFGHSMGGHLALRAARSVRPDGLILLSPMLDILPEGVTGRLLRLVVRCVCALGLSGRPAPGSRGAAERRGRFDGNLLTGDERRFARTRAFVAHDPRLQVSGPTYGWLGAAFRSIDRVAADPEIGRLAVPVLLLQSGRERIVSNRAQNRLCRHLPDGTLRTIPGALHEIFSETDEVRDVAWAVIDRFLAGRVITGELSAAGPLREGAEGPADEPESQGREQDDHSDAAQVVGRHECDVLADSEGDQAHFGQTARRVGEGDDIPGQSGDLRDQQAEAGRAGHEEKG